MRIRLLHFRHLSSRPSRTMRASIEPHVQRHWSPFGTMRWEPEDAEARTTLRSIDFTGHFLSALPDAGAWEALETRELCEGGANRGESRHAVTQGQATTTRHCSNHVRAAKRTRPRPRKNARR